MSVKLLTEHNSVVFSLKEGCTGSSESTLMKMPHCRKSCFEAQLTLQVLLDHKIKVVRVKIRKWQSLNKENGIKKIKELEALQCFPH